MILQRQRNFGRFVNELILVGEYESGKIERYSIRSGGFRWCIKGGGPRLAFLQSVAGNSD